MASERDQRTESKITYSDGDQTRAIRGEITKHDDFFVYLQRRDRTIQIAKRCIIKIETNTGGEG